jgi:hypothetical protein
MSLESMESPEIELHNLRNAFKDHQAEIERLNELCLEKDRLITELADALDAYTPDAEGGYRKAKELIQHAREITKDK